MKRKKGLLLVALMSVFALCGSFSACEGISAVSNLYSLVGGKVELTDFADKEETVVLGEKYSLPDKVADTQGKEYDVQYRVKSVSEEKARVVNGEFLVENFEDYCVTCSARIGFGDVRVREITLKVKDENAPRIVFGKIADGTEGVRYTLPQVTVQDDSKALLRATTKVYKANGEEVVTTDGEFVPQENGKYFLEATATDASGNTSTERAEFYVYNGVRDFEVISFENEDVVRRIVAQNAEISYLEDYESEDGVVKVSYTGGYWANQFSFLPLRDVAELSDIYDKYEFLVLKAYIVKTDAAPNAFSSMAIKDCVTNRDYYSLDEVKYNQWAEYKFDIDVLKAFENQNESALQAKIWGFGNDALSKDEEYYGEFYLAGIEMVNTVEITLDGVFEFGNTLNITAPVEGDYAITVRSPSGVITNCVDGVYEIVEYGTHSVTLRGDGWYGMTEFLCDPLAVTPKKVENVALNDMTETLVTYGASYTVKNEAGKNKIDGRITLAGGTYTGTNAKAMGDATVPYVAFEGEYAPGSTVVVDFTGNNMPNIAFFADQPNENTANFVGARGLMFSQDILNKDSSTTSETNAQKIRVYGPNLFYYYKDSKGPSVDSQMLTTPKVSGYSNDYLFQDYKAMVADTTTEYRLLVRFNAGTNICWDVVLMKKAESSQAEYEIVWQGYKATSQPYKVENGTYGSWDVSSGCIILYGRPYQTTVIDRIHGVYDSDGDGQLVKSWTGIDPWSSEAEQTSAVTEKLTALPKKKEEY